MVYSQHLQLVLCKLLLAAAHDLRVTVASLLHGAHLSDDTITPSVLASPS